MSVKYVAIETVGGQVVTCGGENVSWSAAPPTARMKVSHLDDAFVV